MIFHTFSYICCIFALFIAITHYSKAKGAYLVHVYLFGAASLSIFKYFTFISILSGIIVDARNSSRCSQISFRVINFNLCDSSPSSIASSTIDKYSGMSIVRNIVILYIIAFIVANYWLDHNIIPFSYKRRTSRAKEAHTRVFIICYNAFSDQETRADSSDAGSMHSASQLM